jgi:hypothetical protein
MSVTVPRARRSIARTAESAPVARLSPGLRKLILVAHVILSVGWLGVVAATLVLALAAGAGDPSAARATYLALDRVLAILVLPPPASFSVAAILTGLILSLGTKWGLFRYWWIVAKLAISIAVLLTGIAFVGAWVRRAITTGPAPETGTLLVSASIAHLVMLGAATVLSIYKPWGRIRRDRP